MTSVKKKAIRSDLGGADLVLDTDARLLQVRYFGQVDLACLDSVQDALTALLDGIGLAGVILDTRQSVACYTPAELIEALELCLKKTKPARCALVTSASRQELAMLVETVTFNHGTKTRAFNEVEEAACWVADV